MRIRNTYLKKGPAIRNSYIIPAGGNSDSMTKTYFVDDNKSSERLSLDCSNSDDLFSSHKKALTNGVNTKRPKSI